jgi:hypothetical protein
MLGLVALGFWLVREDFEFTGLLSIVIGIIGAIIVICFTIGVSISLSETVVSNEKIKMYTEENSKIEKQIDTVVKEYMEYEGKTFEKLKCDSSITLVSLYPELKSDELVKTQISTYQENNKKIKELKETKINGKIYKWWLYFGG